MINFLPPEAKSAVKREYVIRTISIWALLFAAIALVGTLLLLPTYVLLSRQLDALATEVMGTENAAGVQAYETAHAALEKADILARQLGTRSDGPTASEVLREIQKTQFDTITLSGYLYAYSGTKVERVEVRGIARTREALAEFSAALERNPFFVRAQVPVSDFAEARNVPFALSIVVAQDTP